MIDKQFKLGNTIFSQTNKLNDLYHNFNSLGLTFNDLSILFEKFVVIDLDELLMYQKIWLRLIEYASISYKLDNKGYYHINIDLPKNCISELTERKEDLLDFVTEFEQYFRDIIEPDSSYWSIATAIPDEHSVSWEFSCLVKESCIDSFNKTLGSKIWSISKIEFDYIIGYIWEYCTYVGKDEIQKTIDNMLENGDMDA